MQSRQYYIFSVGHSGTAWLSNALTARRHGHVCLYRPRLVAPEEVPPGSWLQPEWAAKGYLPYLLEMRSKFCNVGDAGSWPLALVPYALSNILAPEPGTKVVLLVRNGRQVIDAFLRHLKGADATTLRPYLTLPEHTALQLDYTPPPVNGDLFRSLCVGWAHNLHLVRTMQAQMPSVPFQVVRIEDIRTNIEILSQYLFGTEHPSPKSIGQISEGSSPTNWTTEQKVYFSEICGESMSYFGYEI